MPNVDSSGTPLKVPRTSDEGGLDTRLSLEGVLWTPPPLLEAIDMADRDLEIVTIIQNSEIIRLSESNVLLLGTFPSIVVKIAVRF